MHRRKQNSQHYRKLFHRPENEVAVTHEGSVLPEDLEVATPLSLPPPPSLKAQQMKRASFIQVRREEKLLPTPRDISLLIEKDNGHGSLAPVHVLQTVLSFQTERKSLVFQSKSYNQVEVSPYPDMPYEEEHDITESEAAASSKKKNGRNSVSAVFQRETNPGAAGNEPSVSVAENKNAEEEVDNDDDENDNAEDGEEEDGTEPDTTAGTSGTKVKPAPPATPARPPILQAYHPTFSWEAIDKMLCKRDVMPSFERHPERFTLFMDFRSLSFGLDIVQPFFCEIALYDIVEKVKLCETFYFDLNSDEALDMIRGNLTPLEKDSRCTKALFYLSKEAKSQNIYFIVTVHKVLSGDLSKIVDPYSKHASLSDKERKAAVAHVQDYCKKLGRWRQPFVWAACPVFNRHKAFVGGENIIFDRFFQPKKPSEGLDIQHLCESAEEVFLQQKPYRVIAGSLICLCQEMPRDRKDLLKLLRGRIFNPFLKPANKTAFDFLTGGDSSIPLATEEEKEEDINNNNNGNNDNDNDTGASADFSDMVTETREVSTSVSTRGRPRSIADAEVNLPDSIRQLRSSSPSPSTRARTLPRSFSSRRRSNSWGSIEELNAAAAAFEPDNDSSDIIKEVLEFPTNARLVPHLEHKNAIFVYPQSVYFGDARNIAVTVRVKESDLSKGEHGLPCVYGQSDTPAAQDELRSGITYHCYKASFGNEFKIELPCNIRPRHHLLFTFYNASCKLGGSSLPASSIIGYSVLPLMQDGRIVDEAYNLPVFKDLRPHYMLGINQLEQRTKAVFDVRLKIASSLYTNDPYVHRFFHTCQQIYTDSHELSDGTLMDEERSRSLVDQNGTRRLRELMGASRPQVSGVSASEVSEGASELLNGMRQQIPSLTKTRSKSVMLTDLLKKQLEAVAPYIDEGAEPDSGDHTPSRTRSRSGSSTAPGTPKVEIGDVALPEEDLLELPRMSIAQFPGTGRARARTRKSTYIAPVISDSDPKRDELLEEVEQDKMISDIVSQVVRSGRLSRKGNISAWRQRWFNLTRTHLIIFKDSRSDKIEGSFPIRPDTTVSFANIDDEKGEEGSVFMLRNGPSMDVSPIPSPQPSPRGGASASAAKRSSTAAAPPADGSGVAEVTEMQLLAETDEDMYCWIRAIAHVQIYQLDTVSSILALKLANPEIVIQFAPTILRLLLAIICADDNALRDAEALKDAAFEALLSVLEIVEKASPEKAERCPLLDSYVQHMFDDFFVMEPSKDNRDDGVAPKPTGYAFHHIAKLWLRLMKKRSDRYDDARHGAAHFSWFLFDCMFKSMVMYCNSEGVLGSSMGRDTFSKEFLADLSSLVREVTQSIMENRHKVALSKLLNRNLALFVRDSFYILDRQYVFELIGIYLRTTLLNEKTTIMENKCVFFQIVCDHEHYLSLCIPGPIVGEGRQYLTDDGSVAAVGGIGMRPRRNSTTSVQNKLFPGRRMSSRDSLMAEIKEGEVPPFEWRCPQTGHFLPLILIKEISRSFRHKERDIVLAKTAFTLRSLLTKHEYDNAQQDHEKKAAIASMYLPLIPCLWEYQEELLEVKSDDAKRDLLACALFVLRNVSPAEVQSCMGGASTNSSSPDLTAAANGVRVLQWYYLITNLLLHSMKMFEYQGAFSGELIAERTAPTILCPSTDLVDNTRGARRGGTLSKAQGKSEKVSNMLAAFETKYSGIRDGSRRSTTSRRMRTEGIRSYRKAAVGQMNTGGGYSTLDKRYGGVLGAKVHLWERCFAAEVSQITIDVTTDVVTPFCEQLFLQNRDAQETFLWFLHSYMSTYQPEPVLTRVFSLYSDLLDRFSVVLWNRSSRQLDPSRCHVWWYQLLRHGYFRNPRLRSSLKRFVFELFHANFAAVGSLTRVREPLVEAFALLYDTLRDPLESTEDDGSSVPAEKYDMRRRVSSILDKRLPSYSQLIRATGVHGGKFGVPRSRTVNALDSSDSGKSASVPAGSRTESANTVAPGGAPGGNPRGRHQRSTTATISEEDSSPTKNNDPSGGSVRSFAAGLTKSESSSTDITHSRTLSLLSDAPPPARSSGRGISGLGGPSQFGVVSQLNARGMILRLEAFFREMQAEAEAESAQTSSSSRVACNSQIVSLMKRLLRIVELSRVIHPQLLEQGGIDAPIEPELVIDSCFEMISLHEEAPRHQVHYLRYLAEFHLHDEHLPEAGRCLEVIADTIERVRKSPRYEMQPSRYWTEEHLFHTLHEASDLFQKASFIERSIIVEKRLVDLYLKKQDFPTLLERQERILSLYRSLEGYATEKEARALGMFYRVGFFGSVLKDLDGMQFVYREPKLTQLSEIHHRLVRLYTHMTTKKVTVLQASGAIDRSTLNPDEVYLQITAVKPHFPLGTKRPTTDYERYTDVRHFVYDTPFTVDGGSHGALDQQFKRRTVITTGSPLPHILARMPVIEKHEVVLSPIECVIEDIKKRTKRLQREVNPSHASPKLKTLTQILSGSVNLQVHGGTAEVCDTFLVEEKVDKYPAPLVAELKECMKEFMMLCGEGIIVSKKLCDIGDLPFQEVLESGFKQLMLKTRKFLFPSPSLDVISK